MKRFRTSIMGMVLVVAAFAMAFAALRSASDLWFSAVYTFTVVLLLLTVIVARFRRGDEKAFWFGFAVFGWGFFLLGFGLWMNPLASFDFEEGEPSRLNPNLLTSRAIFVVVTRLRTHADAVQDIEKITWNTIGIAHLLITMVLAVCGGMIGALLRRRRGKIVSVKSLAILAALAAVTTFVSSGFSPKPPALFFPKLAFDERKEHSDFVAAWYSGHLRAMGEPSLWQLSRNSKDAIVYRLLWLPSFHHSICVRIDRTPGGPKLHATVLDGQGGYEPGLVAIERNIVLPEEEWKTLNQLLERAGFWTMPTRLADDGGCDGDQLIVEGVSEGTYHLVDRWMPEPAYLDLCRHMLDLTGLDVERSWGSYH
jgi:hypothetical protein